MSRPAAPRLNVLGVELFEQPLRPRAPRRFGLLVEEAGAQVFARVGVRLDDGRESWGYAADALAATWFELNPRLSATQKRHQLRKALELAAEAYRGAGPMTAFELSVAQHRPLRAAGAAAGLGPLAAGFGPALLDRAVLDALCRIEGTSFWQAMRANRAGMRPHAVLPDLAGFDFDAWLAGLEPARRVEARHTIGLHDPLVAADQAPGSRLGDGLPQTLEEVLRAHGQRAFNIELAGDATADVERLTRIAGVLDTVRAPLHVTLDGHERYDDAEAVVELWSTLEADPALQRLCDAVLFIGQPTARALVPAHGVEALARIRPVVADAADSDYDAFGRARALGYAGVSSRGAKGIYRSLANLARCRVWNHAGEGRYFMSADDLGSPAGLAMQQDLALAALLGLPDVELNGHQRADGLAGRPALEQQSFVDAHADLYLLQDGRVRLKIEQGLLDIGSLDGPAFGSAVVPDLSATAPMQAAEWPSRETTAVPALAVM